MPDTILAEYTPAVQEFAHLATWLHVNGLGD